MIPDMISVTRKYTEEHLSSNSLEESESKQWKIELLFSITHVNIVAGKSETSPSRVFFRRLWVQELQFYTSLSSWG